MILDQRLVMWCFYNPGVEVGERSRTKPLATPRRTGIHSWPLPLQAGPLGSYWGFQNPRRFSLTYHLLTFWIWIFWSLFCFTFVLNNHRNYPGLVMNKKIVRSSKKSKAQRLGWMPSVSENPDWETRLSVVVEVNPSRQIQSPSSSQKNSSPQAQYYLIPWWRRWNLIIPAIRSNLFKKITVGILVLIHTRIFLNFFRQ